MNGLERAFARMGARVEFDQWTTRNRFSGRIVSEDLALDVRRDRFGEYFLISRAPASTTELVVLDVQPTDRHLLLLSRNGSAKHRFLLGHDERHWFVAGIPETTPVSRVRDAKQALKPDLVQSSERGVRAKYRNRRSNAVRIRQGEWFFIPAPDVRAEKFLILRKEPIARGGGKPHLCEELCRFGGETVYVRGRFLRIPVLPNGAELYTMQVTQTALRGDVPATFRLSLLPPLASAAAVAYKLTGSDKGVW